MSELQNAQVANLGQSQIFLPDHVTDEIKDIGGLLNQMNVVFNETAKTRKELQIKLEAALEKTTINPNDDPKQLDAQMNFIEKVDQLVSSREKAFVTRITTRLRHRETEESSKLLGAMSARILKDFIPGGETAYVPSAGDALSPAAIEIIENKLAAMNRIDYDDGELKRDPSDVS